MAWTDQLIAAYNFEDNTNLGKDSYSTNDLTNVGSATQDASGRVNNALSLNGSSQWLSHADNADFSFHNTSWTVTMWVNATALGAGFHTLFGKFDSSAGTGNEYLVFWHPTFQIIRVAASVDGTNATIVTVDSLYSTLVGTWSFVEVHFDFPNTTLAITQENQAPATIPLTNTFDGTNLFEIGENVNGASWAGKIDCVNIWKRLLTSGERAALYNGGAGLQYPFVSNTRRHCPSYSY